MTIFRILRIAISSLGGFLAYWLGGFDTILMTLLALTILDFATGIITALYLGKFTSRICTKGIVRKVYIYFTVVLANIVQILTGGAIPIREVVIMFYIVSEGASNLENIGKVIEYPEKLKKVFEQLNGGAENE